MSFSTADLCDKYNDKVQVMEMDLESYGGECKFEGEIVTIKLDEDNSDLVSMLRDEKGKGRVVVIDVEGKYCAVVGDTLMGFAKKNGWAGILINGFVRDIVITKSIPVGLKAIGTCPRKSPKKSASQRDIELNFGGVVFKTGGFLYADEDGVIVSDNILE